MGFITRFIRGCLVQFVFILLIFGVGHIANAQTPVALIVQLTDDAGFRSSMIDHLRLVIAQERPGMEIRVVNVDDSFVLSRGRERRTAPLIGQGVVSALRPGDEVALLMINTHGATVRDRRGRRSGTRLQGIGRFYSDGEITEALQTSLGSLRGRMQSNATVILNSCSTFCGGSRDAKLRAKAFMDFLQIPDGRIYGATVIEATTEFDHPDTTSPESFKKTFRSWLLETASETVKLLPVVVGPAALFVSSALPGQSGLLAEDSLFTVAALTGVSSAALASAFTFADEHLAPTLTRFVNWTFFNRGLLFSFNGGGIVTTEKANKRYDLSAMISDINCELKYHPRTRRR